MFLITMFNPVKILGDQIMKLANEQFPLAFSGTITKCSNFSQVFKL